MENKVLAIVNGNEITENDLVNTAKRFPQDRQGYMLSPQGRKQLLDQMVSFEVYALYAKELGVEEESAFKALLENAKKEILTQFGIQKVLSQVSVSKEEVEKYYEANKNLFKTEEAVTARHILIDSEEKAKEIIDEINKGLSFEEAAAKYSSCPSKEQGGNLGSFTRGRMVPEFEKAAFELPIGELSVPVKTQFGYHIIKVEERSSEEDRPFEEVQNTIYNELLNERQSIKYMEVFEELKKKYNVELK